MIVVFTNGCFDLIHRGHIDFLTRARALGDRLVVGLNSDSSVRGIRGTGRPFVSEADRAFVLRALSAVDEVLLFDETTPARLIEDVCPDVLVKGGDWSADQIVGADWVRAKGGQVVSLPVLPGYSTTALVERIQLTSGKASSDTLPGREDNCLVTRSIREHQETVDGLLEECLPIIYKAGEVIATALRSGHRLFLFGNGGSAADAQHIAADYIGRFECDRRGFAAIALGANSSNVTAIGNDYGFELVFAKQLEALATPGDIAVGLSTSGESANVIAGVMTARRLRCRTIALTGATGKRLASLCDLSVLVPSRRTPRVQEAHILVGHLWRELLDAR